MPALIQFYEKHTEERGKFEILAFHDPKAKTFEELDAKLKPIIEKVWNGKSLPFPILLDATGNTQKSFGIAAWPTAVLIDPEGCLFEGGSEEMLEQKLMDGKAP